MLLPLNLHLTKDDLFEISTWAKLNKHKFKPNGNGRQYGILYHLSPISRIWDIRNKIVEKFKLQDFETEPMFQDFCGFITDGGQIHPHQDPNKDGFIHTRFNVLISKPKVGGLPIIDEQIIEVEEGDVWFCSAGTKRHYCQMVHGDKPRIVLSFGFLIPCNLANIENYK